MKFLHSDGASNVDSHVVHELCKLLGIGKTKSSCLHGQGDSMSESMVKVLKSCIQKQVDLHRMRTIQLKYQFQRTELLWATNS